MVEFNYYRWIKIAIFIAIVTGFVTMLVPYFVFHTPISNFENLKNIEIFLEGWGFFGFFYAIFFTSYVFRLNLARTDPLEFLGAEAGIDIAKFIMNK
jgi:hypothetical protein